MYVPIRLPLHDYLIDEERGSLGPWHNDHLESSVPI